MEVLSKTLFIRTFFCAVPGIPAGLLGMFFGESIWLGVAWFLAVFWLGWQVTKPVQERGEGTQNE